MKTISVRRSPWRLSLKRSACFGHSARGTEVANHLGPGLISPICPAELHLCRPLSDLSLAENHRFPSFSGLFCCEIIHFRSHQSPSESKSDGFCAESSERLHGSVVVATHPHDALGAQP